MIAVAISIGSALAIVWAYWRGWRDGKAEAEARVDAEHKEAVEWLHLGGYHG